MFGSFYRSTDEGQTWEKIDTLWKDTPIRAIMGRDSFLTVITDTGMYRSLTYGNLWAPIYIRPRNHINYKTIFYKGAVFYGSIIVGLYESIDSFKTRHGIFPGDITCLYIADDTLYAGTTSGVIQIYKTDDTSFAYRSMNTGFIVHSPDYNVSGFAEVHGVLYCVTDSGFFRRNPAGKWEQVNALIKSAEIFGGTIQCLQAIDKYIIAGTNTGLLRSEDEGEHWEKVSPEINDTIRDIVVVGTTLIASSHFSVYRSTDNGATWKASVSGLTYRLYPVSCMAASGNTLYSGTDGGGVYLSTNSGISWFANNGGLPSLSVRTLAVKDNEVIAATSNGINVFSGNTWQLRNEGLPSTAVYTLTPTATGIIAGTGSGGIAQKNDGDSVWHSLGKVTKSYPVIAVTVTENGYLAGTNGAGSYRSTDAGNSWQPLPDITDQRVTAFAQIDNDLFASTGGSGVFHSSDAGEHWEAINTGLTDKKVTTILAFGILLFAATDHGIFESSDLGKSWQQQNAGLENMTMASLSRAPSYIYASTKGAGIYRAYLGEGRSVSAAPQPSIYLFPNPATTQLHIDWSAIKNVPAVHLRIYSILGVLVYDAVYPVSQSAPSLTADIHSLPPGSYSVSIDTDGGSTTQRLLILAHD